MMLSSFKCSYLVLVFSSASFVLVAQDVNIDSLMQAESAAITTNPTNTAIHPFRSTRVSNGHSVETLPAGILDIKVQHRFGYLSGGWGNFFGLDDATIRIGADYGITDRLMIGGGRASFDKQWDGFLKYKILEQQAGKKPMPLSLSLLISTMIQTMPSPPDIVGKLDFKDRLYYAGQLLVARRFGNALSLQLMPTLVHYNLVPNATDNNDIFSMGFATAIRITHRADLIIEYYHVMPSARMPGTRNSLAIGFDIETAGHVFQIMLTNASGIAERPFITESSGKFFDGDIRLGFNISRVFHLSRRGRS